MDYDDNEYRPSPVSRITRMTQYLVLCILLSLTAVFSIITLFRSHGVIPVIFNLINAIICVIACAGAWMISQNQTISGISAVQIVAIIKQILSIIGIVLCGIVLIVFIIALSNIQAPFEVYLILFIVTGLIAAFLIVMMKYCKGIVKIMNHGSSVVRGGSVGSTPRGLSMMALILAVLNSIFVIVCLLLQGVAEHALNTVIDEINIYGNMSSTIDNLTTTIMPSDAVSIIQLLLPPLQYFIIWSCARNYELSQFDID